jgi:CheY-like chemotaxis protein
MTRDALANVLIIEDQRVIAEDIAWIVSDLGHRVGGIAQTHFEAIAIAKQMPPDLILSEIQLADGSSGLDAVTEILEELDVPVIFITASPRALSPSVREKAFVLAKPFRERTLKATIEQALSRQCGCSKL